MKKACWRVAAVFLFGLGGAGPGLAMRVGAAAAPAPDAVRLSAQIATAVQADDSSSLRQGVVMAVTPAGDRLQIQGVWLEIVTGKTQVINQGRVVPATFLQKGQAVTFTMAPASPASSASTPSTSASTLGVIYVP